MRNGFLCVYLKRKLTKKKDDNGFNDDGDHGDEG